MLFGICLKVKLEDLSTSFCLLPFPFAQISRLPLFWRSGIFVTSAVTLVEKRLYHLDSKQMAARSVATKQGRKADNIKEK